MRGSLPAPPITVSVGQKEVIEKLLRRSGKPKLWYTRLRILIMCSEGIANKVISRELGVSNNMVKKWRTKWNSADGLFDQIEAGECGLSHRSSELTQAIIDFITDSPRSGRPPRISADEKNQIIALACEDPSKYGIPVVNWTHELLAKVAVEKGIVDSISARNVGFILKKNELKPHKSKHWLYPRIDDWAEFKRQVKIICDVILLALSDENEDTIVISVDEKMGIQALGRTAMSKMIKGSSKRIEYEYVRNGTTGLIAGLNINTGKLENYVLRPTRKENDFVDFIKAILSQIPKDRKIIFIADQLNIHQSESLVRLIADEINFNDELGTKAYKGILKSQKSRQQFLTNTEHRIRFVYTPVHCSWLNPIENWFSILQKRVIKYGDFDSVEILKQSIQEYIEYSNQYMAKQIQWKFKGFNKTKKLRCHKLAS